MSEELKAWEVAKLIEENCGPVELEVWNGEPGRPVKKTIKRVDFNGLYSCYTFNHAEGSWWQHARLPQEKKLRPMTGIELAWKAGHRWVFSDTEGDSWTNYVHTGGWKYMAPILEGGQGLGEWVKCEVEE